MSTSSGGSGAAGGFTYQARYAAWTAAHLLAGGGSPGVAGLWTAPIDRIDCETGEGVDDCRILPRTGAPVVVQCKRTINLAQSATSEFGKTVDQFVRHHLTAGREADRLVLATTTDAPSSAATTATFPVPAATSNTSCPAEMAHASTSARATGISTSAMAG